MGSSVEKNNNLINKTAIPQEKIFERNGALYCELERKEQKLSPMILKGMKTVHKFSCDCEDWDLSCIEEKKRGKETL